MAQTNGSANGTTFTLKNVPVENPRPMKVRVIGAGFSGILAAIRSGENVLQFCWHDAI